MYSCSTNALEGPSLAERVAARTARRNQTSIETKVSAVAIVALAILLAIVTGVPLYHPIILIPTASVWFVSRGRFSYHFVETAPKRRYPVTNPIHQTRVPVGTKNVDTFRQPDPRVTVKVANVARDNVSTDPLGNPVLSTGPAHSGIRSVVAHTSPTQETVVHVPTRPVMEKRHAPVGVKASLQGPVRVVEEVHPNQARARVGGKRH